MAAKRPRVSRAHQTRGHRRHPTQHGALPHAQDESASASASGVFEDEDGEDGGSIASYEDGFDEHGYGDEDDRTYLNSLPDLERQTVLAERMEKRDKGRELVRARRRMREQQKQMKAGVQTRRGKRLSRMHEEDEEDSDSSEEEMPEYAKGIEAALEEGDEDDDYDDPSAKKAKAKRRKGGRRDAVFGPGAEAFDDDDDDGFGDAAGSGGFADDAFATSVKVSDSVMREVELKAEQERSEKLLLPVLNQLRAKRDFLTRIVHEPWFEEAVKGMVVRVFLGTSSRSGVEKYRVARIGEVRDGAKPYRVQDGVTTSRQLVVYVVNKDESKTFPLTAVSNARVTDAEFAEYLTAVEDGGRRPPTVAWLRRSREECVAKASTHEYTPQEVDELLRRRDAAADASGERNLAMRLTDLSRRLDASRLRLFEGLKRFKADAKLPREGEDEGAALDAILASLEGADLEGATALRKEAEAERKRLEVSIQGVRKEVAKRRRSALGGDDTLRRNTSLNRKSEQRNAERRIKALRRMREVELRHKAVLQAKISAAGPGADADAITKAAVDPIKQRVSFPERIWRVKDEEQALKDMEVRKEGKKGAAKKDGAADKEEPAAAKGKAEGVEKESRDGDAEDELDGSPVRQSHKAASRATTGGEEDWRKVLSLVTGRSDFPDGPKRPLPAAAPAPGASKSLSALLRARREGRK